ncbi:type IV toxin-antitoxin system AbiEi family antitoxin domain-containing protein [Klenkia sp. LSe6-5]|uniref:Type IV toxin-antitoxin system AbiEi family antitoxin domain-containing protein n=1 Tax=Klenkia sesuvii TaxID=3103137 RepID=A0ABU8DXW0_9ACTN
MTALPLAADARARSRLGILTTADLHAAGVTETEVRTEVRAGRWVRLRTGVFVARADLAEVEATGRRHGLDALAVLASLDRPTTALAGESAAWVWGLPQPRGATATVQLVDPHRYRSGRGWRMTRAALPPGDVVRRGAYDLTSPARTLVDLARDRTVVDAVAAVDAALLRGLVTTAELAAVLAARASVPGIPRAVRAVALADGRAESWLETKGRLEWDAADLRPFTPQVELWHDGEYLVADGWDEEAALAVMLDGRLKYVDGTYGRTGRDEVWREKRAEDRLRAAGVRFVRLALADFAPRPWREHVACIRALQAVPGPAVRTFRAVPRAAGRVREQVTVDDGWLVRADDRVGGPPSGSTRTGER